MSSEPLDPYDVNFCFPVPEKLESERVALAPFIPSKDAELFISQALPYPEMFAYLPFGPFASTADFITNLIEGRVQKDPGYILFAVYDKTKPPSNSASHPGALAGLIGLLNSSPDTRATEIGCVMILPPFRRTHVASNAVGLLLHYALDLPSDPQPRDVLHVAAGAPLGLRRVVWQANVRNAPSVRLAERMGFAMEGLLRWDRVLPESKCADGVGNGRYLSEGDPKRECVGRDTALLSLCWDDWESGAREKVDAIMRRVK